MAKNIVKIPDVSIRSGNRQGMFGGVRNYFEIPGGVNLDQIEKVQVFVQRTEYINGKSVGGRILIYDSSQDPYYFNNGFVAHDFAWGFTVDGKYICIYNDSTVHTNALVDVWVHVNSF